MLSKGMLFLFLAESQNIFYLRSSARSSATGLLIGESLPPKVKIEADLASAELVYKGPKKKDISKIEVCRYFMMWNAKLFLNS